MVLKGISYEVLDWVDLAQCLASVSTIMKFPVPYKARSFVAG